MKLFNAIILASALTAGLYACKDDNDEQPPLNNSSSSRPQLLTRANWKVSTLISSGTDIWNSFLVEACNRDNQYRFRADDSLSLYDMSSKCSPSDPDSSVSYYKLYNNNTQIILNLKLAGSVQIDDTADILELSESTLKLNAEYSGFPGTITFIHP